MKIKRLLFLATYFPDPKNPSRGNWALEQAQAFQESGIEVLVVVPTPWVPGILGRLHPKLASYSDTPGSICMGNLKVEYPRWICYPWHFFNTLNRRFPDRTVDLGWLFSKVRINRIIKNFKPDTVVAHHTLVAGQLAVKLCREHKVPYVVTDHEVGDFIGCRNNKRVHEIFEKVGRHSTRMVVVSNAMKKEAEAVLPGISFSTIYNGSSFDVFRGRHVKGQNEQLTVFCCSKFYGRKDIPLLIKAFDAVVERGLDLKLRIAGDGPDRAKIEACLSTLRHKDRVELLGLIPSPQVQQEMRKADIFALVGWAEPFGVVFLEAMASGLPLVISEDAGVSEVLHHGKSAMFTQPHDQESVESALVKLSENPALRRAIGEEGQRIFSERFKWSNVINNYLHLFEEPEARQ